MGTNNVQEKEEKEEITTSVTICCHYYPVTYHHRCGYCGSTNLPIPFAEMYGQDAVGWDCCPDCGGV